MAMGYAASSLSDEWSPLNNIGALAETKQPVMAGFTYQNLWSVPGLGKKAFSIIAPLHRLYASASIFSFGDEFYNETRFGFGVGHKIGFVSLGMQLNFLQTVIEQFGTNGIFSLDAGGVAEIIPGLKIGAVIQDFSMSQKEGKEQKREARMQLALAYEPEDFLKLVVAIDHDEIYHDRFRTGFEYAIHNKLYIRSGIALDPVVNYFGLGVRPGIFRIDYACSIQQYLGINHQASLCIRFKSKK